MQNIILGNGRVRDFLRRVVIMACLALLPAFGMAASADLNITASKSSFAFQGFTGSFVTSQSITFTLAEGSGTYYGLATVDKPDLFSVSFTPTGARTAVVTLTPLKWQAGRSTGNVTFTLCNDPQCASVAWSRAVPYTMSVFSIATTEIAIGGFEGAVAPAKAITITPPDTLRQLAISTGAATPAWLSGVHDTDSTFSLTASAVGLKSGTYKSTAGISFAGVTGGPTLSIPVSFKVESGIVAPAAKSIDLNLNTTAANLSGSVLVGFNGMQNLAWSAVSDQAWLVLSPAGGTGAGSLAYAIDAAKLGTIANWTSATAQVKISAAGLSDVSFRVTLNKKLPEIYMVSPNPRPAGVAGTVKVNGRGLSQFTDASAVRIAGVTGLAGAVVSDTEALLSVPALAAGRYAVSVPNAAGLSSLGSSLAVVAPAAASYATLANSGEKRSMLFDASRNAVYAVNRSENTLVRYRLTEGQVDGLVVSQINDLALAPDLQTLYVGSGTSTLLAVNPDTMEIKTRHTAPAGFSLSVGWSTTRGMPTTSNGRLWFPNGSTWSSLGYFDFVGSTFATYKGLTGTNGSLYSPRLFGVADGSKMVATQGALSSLQPSHAYTTAGDRIAVMTGVPQAYALSTLSSDGRKMLLDSEAVYDLETTTLIGNAKVSTAGLGTAAVLSPDGSRVYRLFSTSANSLTINRVEVFDATRVTPGTSSLVSLGQIAVTDQAMSCGAQPAYGCDVVGAIAISPLGDRLFWAGNQRLVVLPIPPALAQSGYPTVTAFEFYHAALDHYFRTTDSAEAAAIDAGGAGPGWVRTGDNFRAYPRDSTTPGLKLVCRMYGSLDPGPNSHFYTANADECASLIQLQASTPSTQKRWNYEGIAFAIRVPDSSGCAAGEKPVYRLYNNAFVLGKDSNHRFTTLQSEYQKLIAAGWAGEGAVMCAPG